MMLEHPTKRVAIVNYNNGNTNSIKHALAELKVSAIYSSEGKDLASADCIILPGVGHFATAMAALREHQLVDVLNEMILVQRKPVLGICLGMQLMTRFSEEGEVEGLNWFDVDTRRMRPADTRRYKVPHIGWNTVLPQTSSVLLQGINTEEEPFYFCHAFSVAGRVQDAVSSDFVYESAYVGVMERANVFGVQFHPEKSQESGLRLLKNFLAL